LKQLEEEKVLKEKEEKEKETKKAELLKVEKELKAREDLIAL